MTAYKKYILLKKCTFILTILVIWNVNTWAQTFKASITEVSQYYRLTFTVSSTNASGFTPPSLNDFEVLNGPATATMNSYQMVNGQSNHSESTSYTYILSAKRSGKITIGSASVRVGNRILHSNSLQVNAHTANAQTGGSKTGNGSAISTENQVQQADSAVTQRDLYIDVIPSRTNIREQEAVLLTYRIHSRLGVGLANTQLAHKPDFKGVISQEIPLPGNQIQTEIEHIHGTTYRTGTILQYVLFPQKDGPLTIPSITFDCTVVQQDKTLSLADAFFNGGGSIGVNVRRRVPPTTIQVQPLPQPQPAAFSGAVGKFDIKGEVLNSSIRTNDVATYRITLEGAGNLKLITPPSVKFPKDFDTYDPKTSEDTQVTSHGLTGHLTFDYTFVPRNIGKYTIPPVDFVFFNTESGKYETIRTRAIEINVTKGKRSNEDVDKQLALLHSDIKSIHPITAEKGQINDWLKWGTGIYWLIHAIIISLFAAIIVIGRKYLDWMNDGISRRRNKAETKAIQRLQQTKSLLADPDNRNFYMEVHKILYQFLIDALGLKQVELNKEYIAQILNEKGISEDIVQTFVSILETCEYAQYAPNAEIDRSMLYEKACQTIKNTATIITCRK